MNVGIIGARGFVGAHLFKHLQKLGFAVTAYIRETVDLCNPASLSNLLEHDVVVNCAVKVSGATADLFKTNVQGVHSLCTELNRRPTLPYLLQLSSGAVYGYADHAVNVQSPVAPEGDYALTKFLGDEVIRLYYKGQWGIARLYFPYGEEQDDSRLIPRLIKRIQAGETIDVSKYAGRPLINPIYIGDLCKQLQGISIDKTAGVHLLGGAECISIRDVAEMIGRKCGVEAKFREVDGVTSNMFCEGKGQVSLEQGLALLIDSTRGCK